MKFRMVPVSELAIILLAIGIRLVYIFPAYNELVLPERDQVIYRSLAINILKGKGMIVPHHPYRIYPRLPETKKEVLLKWKKQQAIYGINRFGTPTSMWEPGYPVFLVIITWLFGNTILPIKIIQVFLDGVSCFFLMRIGKPLGGITTGKIAGLCFTFYPLFIYYTAIVMAETLLIFLLTLLIFITFKGIKTPGTKWWLLAGLIGGTLVLTRSSLLGLIPLLGLVIVVQKISSRKKLVYILIYSMGFIIILTPWILRNHRVHGKYFLMATRGGLNLWWRNNPFYFQDELEFMGVSIPPGIKDSIKHIELLEFPDFTIETEPARDAILKKRMLKYITSNPKLFSWLCWTRFKWIMGVSGGTVKGTFYTVTGVLSYGILAILSIAGLYMFLRNRVYLAIIPALIILYFISFYTLTHGGIRYRLPADTCIILLASYTFNFIIEKIRDRGKHEF